MSDKTFFDTNILVYASDISDPAKTAIARKLLRLSIVSSSGVLSYQVLQEFYNTAFRKFQPVMTDAQAVLHLNEVLGGLEVIRWSRELLTKAFSVRARYHFSWYDSLIVSAALEARCDTLYTEDLQRGQVIEGLTIVNPFA